MVIVKYLIKIQEKLKQHYYDEATPWPIFKANWRPTWQLRHSEVIELRPARIVQEYKSSYSFLPNIFLDKCINPSSLLQEKN
jgi:hypothetical protein